MDSNAYTAIATLNSKNELIGKLKGVFKNDAPQELKTFKNKQFNVKEVFKNKFVMHKFRKM